MIGLRAQDLVWIPAKEKKFSDGRSPLYDSWLVILAVDWLVVVWSGDGSLATTVTFGETAVVINLRSTYNSNQFPAQQIKTLPTMLRLNAVEVYNTRKIYKMFKLTISKMQQKKHSRSSRSQWKLLPLVWMKRAIVVVNTGHCFLFCLTSSSFETRGASTAFAFSRLLRTSCWLFRREEACPSSDSAFTLASSPAAGPH